MIFVGPSGCGKTTALRMVAGLEEVTSGEIRSAARTVNDLEPSNATSRWSSRTTRSTRTWRRRTTSASRCGCSGLPKSERAPRVARSATLLGIGDLLRTKPRELSGGQRQRVAMGRAIIRHPQAFLMDEPLSNLDAKLRVQMRAELVKLHRRLGVTTIYVTHDQTEAMTLGQRVAVLDKRRDPAGGHAAGALPHPANTFVASFIGSPPMNFLEGTLQTGASSGPTGFPSRRSCLDPEARPGREAHARPATGGVLATPAQETNGTDSALRGEVDFAEQLGSEAFVDFRVPGLRVLETADRPIELAGAVVRSPRPAAAAPAGRRRRAPDRARARADLRPLNRRRARAGPLSRQRRVRGTAGRAPRTPGRNSPSAEDAPAGLELPVTPRQQLPVTSQ